MRTTPACRCPPSLRSSNTRACSAPSRTRAICCGRFGPHSRQRFVRHTEDPAIQRHLAFPPCALTRDLTAGPSCGSTSLRRPHLRALSKTRMNTRFPPAHDGPNETRDARACGLSDGGSLYAFRQPPIDRRRLSVAVPAVFAGMRSGGRRDVAVDAGMVIGVEPSGALGTVIGTIAEASPFLRQCSGGCAQQQRHCHAKFYCTHGQISSRSIVSHGCYRLTVRLMRSAHSQHSSRRRACRRY